MSDNSKPQSKKATEVTDELTELLSSDAGSSVAAPEESPSAVIDAAVATDTDTDATGPKVTKAGPRSHKALAEAEAEAERKTTAKTLNEKPATLTVTKPNPLKRHGKAYRWAAEQIDSQKHYELAEAIALAQKTVKVKFDPSLELHINLGVDPKQADQMVRSTVVLPAGTGKTLRLAVLAPADQHAAAKDAGANVVGAEDLIAKIEKGQLNFDSLIATPDMMPKLAKLAKILGPKGLMPSPKSGTVSTDVAKTIKEAMAGKVEFRIDKQAIVHQAIGKASFKTVDLEQNAKAVINAVMKAKPAAAKGTYVNHISLSSSMGPGIKLDTTQAIATSNPKSKV